MPILFHSFEKGVIKQVVDPLQTLQQLHGTYYKEVNKEPNGK